MAQVQHPLIPTNVHTVPEAHLQGWTEAGWVPVEDPTATAPALDPGFSTVTNETGEPEEIVPNTE